MNVTTPDGSPSTTARRPPPPFEAHSPDDKQTTTAIPVRAAPASASRVRRARGGRSGVRLGAPASRTSQPPRLTVNQTIWARALWAACGTGSFDAQAAADVLESKRERVHKRLVMLAKNGVLRKEEGLYRLTGEPPQTATSRYRGPGFGEVRELDAIYEAAASVFGDSKTFTAEDLLPHFEGRLQQPDVERGELARRLSSLVLQRRLHAWGDGAYGLRRPPPSLPLPDRAACAEPTPETPVAGECPPASVAPAVHPVEPEAIGPHRRRHLPRLTVKQHRAAWQLWRECGRQFARDKADVALRAAGWTTIAGREMLKALVKKEVLAWNGTEYAFHAAPPARPLSKKTRPPPMLTEDRQRRLVDGLAQAFGAQPFTYGEASRALGSKPNRNTLRTLVEKGLLGCSDFRFFIPGAAAAAAEGESTARDPAQLPEEQGAPAGECRARREPGTQWLQPASSPAPVRVQLVEFVEMGRGYYRVRADTEIPQLGRFRAGTTIDYWLPPEEFDAMRRDPPQA